MERKHRPATDRQCEYLNALGDKARRIEAAARSRGHIVYKDPLVERDYFRERDKGMTMEDASALIAAWRRMVLYGNMTLALYNLPQV